MFSCLVALAHQLNQCVFSLGIPHKISCTYFAGGFKGKMHPLLCLLTFIQAVD